MLDDKYAKLKKINKNQIISFIIEANRTKTLRKWAYIIAFFFVVLVAAFINPYFSLSMSHKLIFLGILIGASFLLGYLFNLLIFFIDYKFTRRVQGVVETVKLFEYLEQDGGFLWQWELELRAFPKNSNLSVDLVMQDSKNGKIKDYITYAHVLLEILEQQKIQL